MSKGTVTYINPPTLPVNPAFTQVVAASGSVKTIYIGTQNAVDAQRNIVGKGDIAAQTAQVLQNIDVCLTAAGAKREHLVIWTIYIVDGQSLEAAFAPAQPWLRDLPHAPANNVIFVPRLPVADFLIGIEAIAVVPE